jgi:uncharacterized Tic20 family protein
MTKPRAVQPTIEQPAVASAPFESIRQHAAVQHLVALFGYVASLVGPWIGVQS